MSGKEVIYKKEGHVVTITLNRPEVHNALNAAMVEGLEESLDKIQKDKDARVLLITGAGEKSFISGSDIKELSERTPLGSIETSRKRQALLNRIAGLNIPSIAAINGYAFGVGCEIALACTFRVASDRAKLGQLEINLGIIPGAGGTQRLPRLIGLAKATELILTGKIVDAEEALRIGLVNNVVPADSLMKECHELAGILAEKSPVAMKYALRAINQGIEVDLAKGLSIESLCLGACFAAEDSKEGLIAFLEKRKPRFRGK
ncbi:MAG: enoyl-CoA hydratase/isomerase family protein [Deltaproteobacteria bacterium]|nr:enoyl-CoA hydratase/isomerase family protein [Deltaproteobacteria bacterium]